MEDMKDKRVKIPMYAAVLLQVVAAIIGWICYFSQKGTRFRAATPLDEMVFPTALTGICVILFVHAICLLVMQTYEGVSKRGVGILMTGAYCLVHIFLHYISYVSNFFASRKGAEYVAAQSVLSSLITMLTVPFTTIGLILAVVAIARFGILED